MNRHIARLLAAIALVFAFGVGGHFSMVAGIAAAQEAPSGYIPLRSSAEPIQPDGQINSI